MRYVFLAILVIAAAIFVFYLWNQRAMYGTPERTLERMISAGSRREVMGCYSRRTRSMIDEVRGGLDTDSFRFRMLEGRADIEVVSEERSGPEALLRVRVGNGPPYELRFVREGVGWKFDISDKLSMALKGVEELP